MPGMRPDVAIYTLVYVVVVLCKLELLHFLQTGYLVGMESRHAMYMQWVRSLNAAHRRLDQGPPPAAMLDISSIHLCSHTVSGEVNVRQPEETSSRQVVKPSQGACS